MSNETGLIFTLRSYFLLDFLFGDNKIANFSQNSIARLESTLHGAIALLFINIKFGTGVWLRIADNYGSAAT